MYRTLYNILGHSWTPVSNRNFGNPNLYFSPHTVFLVYSYSGANSIYTVPIFCKIIPTQEFYLCTSCALHNLTDTSLNANYYFFLYHQLCSLFNIKV